MNTGAWSAGKEKGEWFTYRYWIDDRLYYVVRVDVGGLGKPTRWEFRTGWLRTDGEAFGGDFNVWRRWCQARGPNEPWYRVESYHRGRVFYNNNNGGKPKGG